MGSAMPWRSVSRPMKMPPMPKPIIVSVKGTVAAARSTPKSACVVGGSAVHPPLGGGASARLGDTAACLRGLRRGLMSDHTPIIVIELVLVFGGAILFTWWQLHSIKVDQRKAAERRAVAQARKEQQDDDAVNVALRDDAGTAVPPAGGETRP
jgi:hypothetical protein